MFKGISYPDLLIIIMLSSLTFLTHNTKVFLERVSNTRGYISKNVCHWDGYKLFKILRINKLYYCIVANIYKFRHTTMY